MPKGAEEPTPARAPAPAQPHEQPHPSVQAEISRAGTGSEGKGREDVLTDLVRAQLSDSKECGNTFRTAEMRIGAGIPGGARGMERPR